MIVWKYLRRFRATRLDIYYAKEFRGLGNGFYAELD